MKYLFFDIECASVFKNTAKICAFGYCLTDEQFHILEKEDIEAYKSTIQAELARLFVTTPPEYYA